MKNKTHLSIRGLNQIINIKASMNLGLSDFYFCQAKPLLGVKLIDYLDWCKVAKLINEGSHLTKEGVNLIREIKSGMNKGRDNNNI